ncbi:YtpI family protein [Salsuginibacillus kocurii]|uniref:YtpI family protein n=1 Tax=Salsuginibacillus kocurii TaxID=427078 RepID=UPI000375CEB6|nr:YtpI family protein [Salsuginibacillus kocurii]
MNQLLVMLFSIAFVFYIFNKVKQFRSKGPAEKRWQQTKANISLGMFVGLFGLNLLVGTRGWVETIVGLVFVGLGSINVLYGYKAYKHYRPYVLEETREQQKVQT